MNPDPTDLNHGHTPPAQKTRAGKKMDALAKFLGGLLIASFFVVPGLGTALQLPLTNVPLFLTVPVPSNILFLTDDSLSMGWDFVYNSGTGNEHNDLDPHFINTFDSFSLNPETGFTSSGKTNRRLFMCPGYNLLAFNLSTTYGPWQGQDKDGVVYDNAWLYGGGTDASPNYDVRRNPYDAADNTTNLAAANVMAYWLWTDSNGDGRYNAGECGDTSTNSGGVSFSNLTTAQKKNFANWYSYHRSRLHVTKYALSRVVAQAGPEVNMGHVTINNTSGNSSVYIKNMNASITVDPKKALLKALSQIKAGGGTPLRSRLDEAGKYYECKAGNIYGLAEGSSACPIATNASGGPCQQNFTVLMTDGYWNGAAPDLPGTGDTDPDGDSPNAAGNTIFDGGAFADNASYTLADVAMHYYERDLAPNLSNRVPVTAGIDEATHQHMVTYGVAFGVTGSLSNDPPNKTDAFAWPDAHASDAGKIDDLRHAAYNGRGKFLSARKPDDLVTALQNTIGSIGDRTGSSASVAVNSRSLSTTTRLYQARFFSGEWSGDLRALAVNLSGDVVEQEIWSTKTELKTQDWNTGRAILTRNATIGIPFRWTTSGSNALTVTQQANLNDDPLTIPVDNDNQGSARLEYLRGSNANEGVGNNYRVRTGNFKLGDIVNSSPIYIGPPPYQPDIDAGPHATFRSTVTARREMVYVGANDGMLHGFDAATGQEKIAYVPTMVFPNLHQLTNPGYAHRYFVDGSPTAADVYGTFTNVSGICATGCWRTVLAGGLGGGGKGVYALDVTDPDGNKINTNLAFNEANASKLTLWELTATGANVSNLGHVFGQPTITRVRTGQNSTAWAVIFGNGYNSDNENAVLYVVNAITGAVIRDIPLVAPNLSPTKNSNGLSMPAVVDTDGDYTANFVYAGDLRGNLWKIDISSNNVNNWDSAYKSGSSPVPLFTAKDANGNEQPITVQPEIGKHPDGQSGYMVYFGTGRYIATGDNTAATSPVQTFYGIWDRGDVSEIPRGKLLPQTISEHTVSSKTVRGVTNTTIGWCTANNINTCSCSATGGNCLGWRDDLLTASAGSAGEKAVSNPVLVGGSTPRIIFTTLVPLTDTCTAGGYSWLMELNPKNGGRLPEQVFDVNGDGRIDSNDMIDGAIPVAGINPEMGIMPEPTIVRDAANKTDLKAETGSTGSVKTLKNYVSGTQGGRQSWRQLK